MVAIRIADPQALAMNNRYVAEYDPSRPGRSPDGHEMIAHLEVTDDPAAALWFPTLEEAVACYRRAHGWREDGEPNRPLTAFSIQFVNVEADTDRAHKAGSSPDEPPATEPACEDCGEPATMPTADGVPLCTGDYAETARMMPGQDDDEWSGKDTIA